MFFNYEQEDKKIKIRNLPQPINSESDMTVVNFCFADSTRSLVSKTSAKSNTHKKQAQRLQLNFQTAYDNTQARRLT